MRGKKGFGWLHVVPVLLLVGVLILLVGYAQAHPPALFDTAGPIAEKERNLIYFALGLSLIVVLPVFGMLFAFAWKYREGNDKAKYSPELGGSKRAETIWWAIPGVLILILSIVTWNSSHDLDPYKKLVSSKQPLTVQVVSLDWKWLFIYPEQGVATVNDLTIPVGVPINFQLTSDAPMNSFWIPRLGGQVYTMPGMMTELHLMADKTGTYRGVSANISGKGFADMKFDTQAVSEADFADWVRAPGATTHTLDAAAYNELAKPTTKVYMDFYNSVESGMFDSIMHKYMSPDEMHMEMAQ